MKRSNNLDMDKMILSLSIFAVVIYVYAEHNWSG